MLSPFIVKFLAKFKESNKIFDNHTHHAKIQNLKFKVKVIALNDGFDIFCCYFACNCTKIEIKTT